MTSPAREGSEIHLSGKGALHNGTMEHRQGQANGGDGNGDSGAADTVSTSEALVHGMSKLVLPRWEREYYIVYMM